MAITRSTGWLMGSIWLFDLAPCNGALCAGDGGGTSLIATVMRKAAPLGLPKLVVSTVDTGPVIGKCDMISL